MKNVVTKPIFQEPGPSLALDTACSSGTIALHHAVKAIRNGECEAAIVGGAHLCLLPEIASQFMKLKLASSDGTCKSFDAAADGYVRSEAVVTLFLQKACVARRVYASILHIKANTDGFKDVGITYPSGDMQKRLLQNVYQECGISPLMVSYVEAHGPGTTAGDIVELIPITDIFCKGLCSIVKVLIAMESELIPPNLHFKNPNPKIPALMDGRVKVVTEPLPWNGGIAAVNSFGFGGVNVHAVLKRNPKERERSATTNEGKFPQIVLYNGRTEEAVETLFNYLKENSVSREFFALLHKSVFSYPQDKPYRGYKILSQEACIEDIKKLSISKRPVWYIFSGMGSQWPAMAKDLMDLDVFARTIHKLAEVLKPYDLDLIEIITKDFTKKGNKITIIHALVSIAAVQVALVDILIELAIKPDGIVGHSTGEMACAYADGCFTAEQTVLAAYWRGKAIEDANLVEGAMAALGLTWEEAKEQCPAEVFPSCHNAEDSVTVSGPKDKVQMFVDKLKGENTFAWIVESCGYAFHSQYIFPAAEKLHKALKSIIPKPKHRTAKWVSSSYAEENWNDPKSQLADASYFVHNLVSSVLFHEALHHVPEDAVVIEIAPHHLFQAILKRVIGPKAEVIGLMKRYTNNSIHLLSSIGKMYTSGLNPDIEKLYPSVIWPVPRGTPMLSSLIKWDHSESWTVAKSCESKYGSRMVVEIDLSSPESDDAYMIDHCIDGEILYPVTGYLILARKALAELKNKDIFLLPVAFEEVKIHKSIILSKTSVTTLLVDITSIGGQFEISEDGLLVATGRIFALDEEKAKDEEMTKYWKDTTTAMELGNDDIYKELRLRGYDYGPAFRDIMQSNIDGDQGLLDWNDNWIVFLDAMIQYSMLSSNRALRCPTGIENITINPFLHMKTVEAMKNVNSKGIPIIHNVKTHQLKVGGIEMKNICTSIAPRSQAHQVPIIEDYQFVPDYQENVLPELEKKAVEKYIQICSSIVKKILVTADKSQIQIFDSEHDVHDDIGEHAVESYLQNLVEGHVFLKNLQQMRLKVGTEGLRNIANISLSNYIKERDLDVLENTLVGEIPLETILDIVVENTQSKKLNIFEVNDGHLPLSVKVCKVFPRLNITSSNCTIAHPMPNSLDKAMVSTNNLNVVEWSLHGSAIPDIKNVNLLILKNLTCSQKELKRAIENLLAVLKSNGFLIVVQRTRLTAAESFLSALSGILISVHSENDLEEIFKVLNLPIIAKKSDGIASSLYLLRKPSDSSIPVTHKIISVETGSYDKWVEELKTELSEVRYNSGNKRIWLVAEKDRICGIIGLVNCLRKEPGCACVKCIFIDPESEMESFKVDHPAYHEVVKKDLLINVFRNGTWGSFRHLPFDTDKMFYTQHAYIDVQDPGELSSLTWVDSSIKYNFSSPVTNTNLCHVYYVSVNLRDVMLANGKSPPDSMPDPAVQDAELGSEFSGRNIEGERMMGLVGVKGIFTSVIANPDFIWKVPDSWTLEEASTVPMAYSTAYYALMVRGLLKRGEKVLIHSGSSDVGQAAIAIALSMGCQVFTSIGSNGEREFLKQQFPQLSDAVFCDSRDTSFEEHILNSTNGKGVCVILNSLEGEKFKSTLRCLAKHGRFLEIGEFNLSNNTLLGREIFYKNISFQSVSLHTLCEDSELAIFQKKELVKLVNEGIRNGIVKPLSYILFDKDQVEQAFRYMITGDHIGKIIIKIREDEADRIALATPVQLLVTPRALCDSRYTYIIIGGLGGFALELSNWLIDRGARNIILTSRSGIRTGYQRLCLRRWKNQSVNVVVSKLDVIDFNQAKKLLEMASKHNTIGGIFNLALVLRDALMENQTVENYRLVCQSKIQSTANLDKLSRELCPNLDWFVCFSSSSCGRGNAGQSNYGFANSVMERICEQRKQEGFPGIAIQWGAIGDTGFAYDKSGNDVEIGGTVPQRMVSCLKILDQFLCHSNPVVSSFVPYLPVDGNAQNSSSKSSALITVANIFGIKDISTINLESRLGDMGMDSLMSVEIQQFLERNYEMGLSSQDLRQLAMKDLKTLDERKGEGEKEGLTLHDKTTIYDNA